MKHPVTALVDEAIENFGKHGVDITPAKVDQYVIDRLKHGDWSPNAMRDEAVQARVRRALKVRGHIITDGTTRVRKSFWKSTIPELEQQQMVREDSSDRDRNQILAGRAVLDFLREKNQDFGYDVYPELFQDEIDRIYSMHGTAAPGREAEAA